MKSLVIFVDGTCRDESWYRPRILSTERFDRIVALFVGGIPPDEDATEDEEGKKLSWYVTASDGIFGPVYAEELFAGVWRSVEIHDVVSCFVEHGISIVTAWTAAYTIARHTDKYSYVYTVEGNGLLDGEACDWIEMDIERHCQMYEPRAVISEKYEISAESELFSGGDAWRSAVLVHEGKSYKIWLRIYD